MKIISLKELKELAESEREVIWEKARGVGREPKVYLHWSAGHYDTKFGDYHINIDGDGDLWTNGTLASTLAGTWRRNTGAVNISLCCGYNANTNKLGAEPPTAEQIEAMAQVIAVVADALWLTIDKKHVMTHGEAADNEDGEDIHENYGPKTTCERWDLEYLGTSESPWFNPWATDGSRGGDVLRGKAIWYKQNGV